MRIFGKDISENILIIAEIGVNHEGNIQNAIKLIKLAASSGVDAVKFQTYDPYRYASTSDPARFARVTKFSLDIEEFMILADEAAKCRIGFFSTPLDETAVQKLDPICPVWKIASADLVHEPTIRYAASTGKPLLISTGLGVPEEIDRALGWVKSETNKSSLEDQVVLLHCVTAYPTPLNEANLLSIPYLRERYGLHVGYSDHTLGLSACRTAVALGATVIEKHFTDQKTGREFRDHELSADPHDMQALVGDIQTIKESLGHYGKSRAAIETPNLLTVRKGIVAAQDLPEGTILNAENLMYARPATEFRSEDINILIGRTLKAAVARGNMISREVLKN